MIKIQCKNLKQLINSKSIKHKYLKIITKEKQEHQEGYQIKIKMKIQFMANQTTIK